MVKTFSLILLFILTSRTIAQTTPQNSQLDGYMMGVSLRQLDNQDMLIADVPLIEARIPLWSDALQFKYGGQLLWGLSDFFVEWYYAAGLIVYPFSEFLGLNTTVRLGSFFFDNISYMIAVGSNFDIPLDDYKIVSLELEYFYRNSRDLFDYVEFAGNSKGESINLDSAGIAIGIAIRF